MTVTVTVFMWHVTDMWQFVTVWPWCHIKPLALIIIKRETKMKNEKEKGNKIESIIFNSDSYSMHTDYGL